MTKRSSRVGIAAMLILALVTGSVVILRAGSTRLVHVVGFFANSNGIYPGDEVRILGIPVGRIDRIEPQQQLVKISFSYDAKYPVPADVKAVVLSPSLVAVRAIQLTPAYSVGPQLTDGATIPQERTAVPVEWDDLRVQLQKLTESLQPNAPGGVSALGGLVNTAADNLRGQGPGIHDTLVKMSQAFSAFGDHSTDLFSTVKNISTLVSALQDSKEVLRMLNVNLAEVTGLLSNDPDEIGKALSGVNDVVGDLQTFVADNRESLGTSSDKLAAVTTTLNESLGDVQQSLHLLPTVLQNFVNIYQPAQGALTGVLALNNFADPISFLCGAIQAASRLGAEQSSKLCVQYLAPIVKNRQYNFLPVGQNLFVGAQARPNEVTYSEDWLRPDHVPQSDAPAAGAPAVGPLPGPLPAESTDPQAGLAGMMVPSGGGS
ncbi:MCE family protein [Mycobacterium sp. NPDC051198]